MLNIVKRPISLISFIFILITQGAIGAELSPLELKSMQTRKFSKPPAEVLEAIKVSGEDNDGTCHTELSELLVRGVQKSIEVFCMYAKAPKSDPVSKIPIIGTLRAMKDIITQNSDTGMGMGMGMVKYQVTMTNKNETIVRMRIQAQDNMTAITKPEIYASEFKRIADALFVQAIEINPALQE